MADFDLAVIGGGLNGVSIARDAAGRGLRVLVLEKNDLGAGASATASPLIQSDLRAFAHGRIGATRRALGEQAVWLRTAPHLVRPVRVVVPMNPDVRPAWAWRLGLGLHDRLVSSHHRPRSETIDLTHHAFGYPLQRPFRLAVDYAAALADIPRLTVLTAVDAAERGATILTGARCIRADRSDIWRLVTICRGQRQIFSARALVNASGGWLVSVAETVLRVKPPKVGFTQSNQIVVRRLIDHDVVFLLQHPDRRLIHLIPLTGKATLIGSLQRPFTGDPAHAAVSAKDAVYLTKAANRYLREKLESSDVLHSIAGIHVFDASAERSRAPDEGSIRLERSYGQAPLLTSFGGEATTARRQAELAMAALAPFFAMPGPWTARAPLPGGQLEPEGVEDLVDRAQAQWPFLPPDTIRRLVRSYGTRIDAILDGAHSRADLGPDFGDGLSGREVSYLMAKEWARFADDVLWRRSRLGMTATAPQRDALAQFMTTGPALQAIGAG